MNWPNKEKKRACQNVICTFGVLNGKSFFLLFQFRINLIIPKFV
ncbi:hypothetical protein NC99_03160 [Sunxiuqinia dokdonensis]|uniref:Uncharacterized protein n=1 Tax=Sunxiuqinia dokdonensis TaxID=1409788 RepID=A0A0L8VEM7_9BACT|nr:hypothetical protein NC99_03160 [Sunxiuqinia dokdonensis]